MQASSTSNVTGLAPPRTRGQRLGLFGKTPALVSELSFAPLLRGQLMVPACKAFILHLERAIARAENVAMLRSHLSIESEIVSAVDGLILTPDVIQSAYVRQRFRPRYPFALNAAEIAAFLSHRAAWRRIIEQNLDFAFIFEDDAQIDAANFERLLAFAVGERSKWEYVLLPVSETGGSGTIVARDANTTLKVPHWPPLRMIGQIVSRNAAEALLSYSEPFDRAVDTFLQLTWVTKLPILVLSPTGLWNVSAIAGGSTIAREHMILFCKIYHEVARPIYRGRILARYRRQMTLSPK
jgi:glycosyl transferase, family 25